MMLKWANFKQLTRFEQSLFGLPLVGAALLLSFFDNTYRLSWHLAFILPAFFAARISGMAFNQLIDRHIDARNPRTKERILPRGEVLPLQALKVALSSLCLFLLCTSFINLSCFLLSLVGAIAIVLYAFMKRIHYACHFFIGFIHGLVPLITYIAMTNTISLGSILLGIIAFANIVGNEVIYAMQDQEFDIQEGLCSIPACLGLKKSYRIAKSFHAFTLVALTLLGMLYHFPWFFYLTPLTIFFSYLFFYKKGIAIAFFPVTVLFSSSLFLGILSSWVWRVMS